MDASAIKHDDWKSMLVQMSAEEWTSVWGVHCTGLRWHRQERAEGMLPPCTLLDTAPHIWPTDRWMLTLPLMLNTYTGICLTVLFMVIDKIDYVLELQIAFGGCVSGGLEVFMYFVEARA